MKKILVLTDNYFMYNRVVTILRDEFNDIFHLFDFKRSKLSKKSKLYSQGIDALPEIDVKKDILSIIHEYDKVISLHCRQIFPAELVKKVQCINIHPGYNPYNRGWYPQVFAIINGERLGATIHIIDQQIDHGPIIARKEIGVESYYTSKEAYEKVLEAEVQLFRENIKAIVDNTFQTTLPEIEGDYHSVADFENLCELDLNEQVTFGEAINRLRALSHGVYDNAYFYDKHGDKIFVKLELNKK